jgi:hypothetical protein
MQHFLCEVMGKVAFTSELLGFWALSIIRHFNN